MSENVPLTEVVEATCLTEADIRQAVHVMKINRVLTVSAADAEQLRRNHPRVEKPASPATTRAPATFSASQKQTGSKQTKKGSNTTRMTENDHGSDS